MMFKLDLQKEFGSKYDKALFEFCKKKLKVFVAKEPSGGFSISVIFFQYKREWRITDKKEYVFVFKHGRLLLDFGLVNTPERIQGHIIEFFLNGYMQARRPFIDAYNPLSDICDYANLLLEME